MANEAPAWIVKELSRILSEAVQQSQQTQEDNE